MGIIKGICISKERGTEKHEVAEAGFVKDSRKAHLLKILVWKEMHMQENGTDRSVCFPLKK